MMGWLDDAAAFVRAATTALGYGAMLAAVIFAALHWKRK